MAFSELLETPNLISRKFWVAEKSTIFHTVGNELFMLLSNVAKISFEFWYPKYKICIFTVLRLAWLLSISVSCSRSLFFRKVWRTWQSLKYVNHHLVASLQHQLWRHTTKAQIVRTKLIAPTLRKNCAPENSNASASFLTKIIHHLCNTLTQCGILRIFLFKVSKIPKRNFQSLKNRLM